MIMPMLPEQIWRRRIESEFEEMQASGENFDSNAEHTKYVISIKGPGLYQQGNQFLKRDSHSAQILLKREYPYAGGLEITWLTPIFHPNIRAEDGRVCIQLVNEWSETQTVASIVNALKQLLEKPNPLDALNNEAAEYFIANPDALKKGGAPTQPPEKKGPRIVSQT